MYKGEHLADQDAHAELTGDLQALSPDREVDIAIPNRADPLFLKKITERCVLLFGSSSQFADLKMYAYRRYQDHRRFLAMEQTYVRQALRRLGR